MNLCPCGRPIKTKGAKRCRKCRHLKYKEMIGKIIRFQESKHFRPGLQGVVDIGLMKGEPDGLLVEGRSIQRLSEEAHLRVSRGSEGTRSEKL